MKAQVQVQVALALVLGAGGMRADSLVLLAADASGFSSQVQAGLQATGKFTQVDVINTHQTTPTAMELEMAGYTDVLAWTNEFPQNGTILGDTLAQFHHDGGRVTIATYGLTNPGAINGGIATGDYAGLVVGTLAADPSGTLVPSVPSDPIFNGIPVASLTYYHDGGFANAALASGATLIATDGMGHNMIARSANGVVNINLYPGFGGTPSDAFWMLLANTFAPLDPPLQPPVANPGGPYSFCPQSKPWLLNGTQSTDPEQGMSEPGNPPDQIIQYAWDLNGANTFTGASGAQPDVTSFFTGLGPGIYPVQLRVTASTATSFPSSGLANLTGTASTQVTVKNSCTCITTLTATATPNGQVQLQWPLTGSNHYNVYRSTGSGASYVLVATTTTAGYLDTNVTSGTTYYYIVREANLLNEETCQSNQVSATPIADTIPPVTSISEAPSANGAGWYNTSVALTLSSTDNPGGTGVKQISVSWNGAQTGSMVFPGNTGTFQLTVEGVTTVTYFATDLAGNVESSHTLTVMIDKTAPAVSAAMNPAPNEYGWNDGPVTVTFTGTDTLSGVQTCTPPVTVNTEGAKQAVSGTCTDNAGNTSAPVTKIVNIDWIPAAISGVPAPGKCVLWAPNNKLVTVATLVATHAATFDVTVSSNEPEDGDGDVVITGSGMQRVVQLRAERLGDGTGRVYTVKAVAANQAGTPTSQTFTCTVPHDQGK